MIILYIDPQMKQAKPKTQYTMIQTWDQVYLNVLNSTFIPVKSFDKMLKSEK